MFGTKKKNKKEPKYLPSEVNTRMLNYRVYYMNFFEKLFYFVLTMVIGGIVGLVFYADLFMVNGERTMATYISNSVVFLVVGFLAAKLFLPIRETQLKEKRKKTLNNQFREMLASLSTAFSAGENLIGAFKSAEKEMKMQFGEKSYIAQELEEIVLGMNSNIPIDRILKNFAKRSDLDDLENFSNIITICYQKGGDMKTVVRSTYDLIGDKITISEEIKTKITSNKMQQNAMSVIPIFLIGYLRVSSSTFAASFASFTGVIVMTIAVCIFIASYLYGKKIIDIKG